MTEKELIDMFIQERINMLLDDLEKAKPKKSADEHTRMSQAEHFINALPYRENKLVQDYVDNIIHMFSVNEPFLYQNGFLDAFRVIDFLFRISSL